MSTWCAAWIRFGDALNLNVHFHSLVLDGVYARDAKGRLHFHPLPPPEDAEVERVARQLARLIQRLLVRRGLGPEADPSEADAVLEDQPLLTVLYAASVAGRASTAGVPGDAPCAWAIASMPRRSQRSRESAARA